MSSGPSLYGKGPCRRWSRMTAPATYRWTCSSPASQAHELSMDDDFSTITPPPFQEKRRLEGLRGHWPLPSGFPLGPAVSHVTQRVSPAPCCDTVWQTDL